MTFSQGLEGATAYDRWFDAGWGAYAFRIESRALLRSAGDLAGLNVLDVGCGTGRMTEVLAKHGARVTGLDIDAAMLTLAQGRTSAPLVLGNAAALPIRDGAFGLAVAVTLCEFVDDVPAVFAELARVVRPGGRFIVGSLNRRSAWGWLAFAAACLILYGRQSFQPFRNMLPLVSLGCLSVAILFARIREKLRRPLLADAGAIALVLLLFGIPLAGYARERFRLEDSRTEAMDWLVAHSGPEDHVLLLRELAFVTRETARLRRRPGTRPWGQALATVRGHRPRFFVAGLLEKKDKFLLDGAEHPLLRRRYRLAARFGENPTPPNPGWWRGNRQVVYIFEARHRRPPATTSPGGPAKTDRKDSENRVAAPPAAARRGAGRESFSP